MNVVSVANVGVLLMHYKSKWQEKSKSQSAMELSFLKIVNSFWPTVFAKKLHRDVWQGSKDASAFPGFFCHYYLF